MENRFKFRAWNKQNKEMYTFTFKDLWAEGCEQQLIELDNRPMAGLYSEFPYHNCIKMQCTGNRKDKNGKPIYEGDIVDWQQAEGGILPPNSKPYRCQIIWGDWQQEAFNCKRIDKEDSCLTFNPEFMEVIGNIYENPELLTNNKE